MRRGVEDPHVEEEIERLREVLPSEYYGCARSRSSLAELPMTMIRPWKNASPIQIEIAAIIVNNSNGVIVLRM